jgi:predicted nucleic acid-binding protein
MMLVLDASMALAWIFERRDVDQHDRAQRVLQMLAGDTVAIVPSLWSVEVANSLLVGERRNIISQAQSVDFLARLDRLPILIDTVSPASRRDPVLGLARQYGLTAYDACYLELALRTTGTLATFDVKLAQAARSAGALVFEWQPEAGY